MVSSLKLEKDYRCLKKGDTFEFTPGINLLVGDQGCGKSTILQLLKNDGWVNDRDKFATVVAPVGTQSFYLDFEAGTSRSMDLNTADHLGIGTGAVIASILSSHGEVVRRTLESMPKVRDSVMLQDEPDMALSMRSIRKFFQLMTKQVKEYNQQIIVACHNPYLMELVGEVYSIEHSRRMPFNEFKKLMEKG